MSEPDHRDPWPLRSTCESCGRYVPLHERPRGGDLALTEDTARYVCPECLQDDVPAARGQRLIPTALRSASPYEIGLGAIALVAALVAAVSIFAPAEPLAPQATGAVLGEVQYRSTVVPPDSPVAILPAVTVGRAAIRTWTDSFERSRLQIIVPIRNDDDRWVRLPAASSTYQIVGSGGEMLAGGLFALPAHIGPGETAYLVDTVSIPGIETIEGLVAESDVVALPADPRDLTLTVTDVRLADGVGGGQLASGTVHNDGEATTRRVIAGVIALGREGAPVAAFYDSFDIGRLDPDEVRAFVTDSQPGGPPIDDAAVSELVGVAFEVDP